MEKRTASRPLPPSAGTSPRRLGGTFVVPRVIADAGDGAGGTLENAQAMAAHESPRTTKLYDRTGDETLDEVERISI